MGGAVVVEVVGTVVVAEVVGFPVVGAEDSGEVGGVVCEDAEEEVEAEDCAPDSVSDPVLSPEAVDSVWGVDSFGGLVGSPGCVGTEATAVADSVRPGRVSGVC